jgi:hypothetical protein
MRKSACGGAHKLCATDLSALVGLHGPQKQFGIFSRLWTRFHGGEGKQASSTTGGNWGRVTIRRHGLEEKWLALRKRALACHTLEAVQSVRTDTMALLFRDNGQLETESELLGRRIQSDRSFLCARVRDCIAQLPTASASEIRQSSAQLIELQAERPAGAAVAEFIRTVHALTGMAIHLETLSRCSYGKHAEAYFCRQLEESIQGEAKWNPRGSKAYAGFASASSFASSGVQTRSRTRKRKQKQPPARWVLEGRVDGFLPGGKLVEIKHRVYGIQERIPASELVQLHAYMQIYGKESIKLAQCVRTSEEKLLSVCSVVTFHAGFWKSVMERVDAMLTLVEMSGGPVTGACLALLDGKARAALMRRLLPQKQALCVPEDLYLRNVF